MMSDSITTTWRQRLLPVAILGTTISLSLLLVSIPTDDLISFLGTENIYIYVYAIAFLGSVTTFASIPYPLIVIGLVAGGLDPLTAGLCAALGVSTADSCTFVAARHGRALLSERLTHLMQRIQTRLAQKPQLLTPGLMVYGTVSPLSNDFAVIALSLLRYRYLQVIVPLAVGNLLYNVTLAYLGVYAYSTVSGWF